METKIVFGKELVEDPIFKEFVKRVLNDLISRRLHRPLPKPGYRYKRDWYDQMSDDTELNAEFFVMNIEKIMTRKSSLSSIKRRIIQPVCEQAYFLTMKFYAELKDKAKTVPPKAKRKKAKVIELKA